MSYFISREVFNNFIQVKKLRGGSKVEKSIGSTGLQVLKFIKTADATVIEKTLLEMVPEKSPQQGNVILWAASIYQSNLKFKCDHNY